MRLHFTPLGPPTQSKLAVENVQYFHTIWAELGIRVNCQKIVASSAPPSKAVNDGAKSSRPASRAGMTMEN